MEQRTIQNVLSRALERGADFAEFFWEDKEELNISAGNGAVNGISSARLCGAGLYLLSGTQRAYVYLNELTEPALLRAADTAGELLEAQRKGGVPMPFTTLVLEDPCPVERYPSQVKHGDKLRVLAETDRAARNASPWLVSLSMNYIDTDQRVLIANTEGVWTEDRRVTTILRLVPTLQNGSGSVGHFSDFTHPAGFEVFRNGAHLDFAAGKVKMLEEELLADEAPSGYVPVVFEGGACTGTFFHEACGHQLEASSLNENSLFRHKLGQMIASEKVTMVDDGTLPGQYGSSRVDDEGMPRQRNVLIENGVLKTFLADRLGARRIGVPRTASGRRQGYCYAPCSRMSNTFLAAGEDDPDEMIRSLPEGLFVTEIGGGTGGDEFTLMAQRAFWIKNGQIDRQVKGAMLLGRGDETMKKIDRVGNVLVYEDGGAYCGADSGLVCTTTSGARMRVSGMVVGGKGGGA